MFDESSKPVIFCHGLESSPHGAKYNALCQAGFDVLAPDFQGMALAGRVLVLVEHLEHLTEPTTLVGSSYGGITALCAAILVRGANLKELILCAPALARQEAPATEMDLRSPVTTRVIHGSSDSVIPIEVSRQWVAQNPLASLLEVEDDHRLASSLDQIVALVRDAEPPKEDSV